jgi:rod shape-determining protein MreB
MIIDIGGGTTDIAVISLGSIVTSKLLKVAGDSFDKSIIKYMRREYNLYIGERTAEDIKMNIGGACPRKEPVSMRCSGRDLLTGLPRTVEVPSDEVLEALDESIQIISELSASPEKTPPTGGDISTAASS